MYEGGTEMSNAELVAVRTLVDSLNEQIADSMTICLVASEQGDFERIEREKPKLRMLRGVVRSIKEYVEPAYKEAMQHQVIH